MQIEQKARYVVALALSLMLSLGTLFAQQNILCIYQDTKNFPAHFIDTLGNLKFTLPADHVPVSTVTPDIGPHRVGLITFGSGICIVRGPQGYYWIDVTGKPTHEFGNKYRSMLTFSEGICVARVNNGEKYGMGKYVFLDTSGKELFNGQRFARATRFVNDNAFVILDTEKQEMGYLDKKGKFDPVENVENKNSFFLDEDSKRNESQKVYLEQTKEELNQLLEIYQKGNTRDGGPIVTTRRSEIHKNFALLLDDLLGVGPVSYRVVNVTTKKVIWTSPPEHRFYYSLADARKVKEKIRSLILTKNELYPFPAEIYSWSNLEQLILMDNEKLTVIPDGISQLQNLEFLSLRYIRLQTLPGDMLQLKKLASIEIDHCGTHIEGFESFLEKSPTLRQVSTMNYDLPDDVFSKLNGRPGMMLNIEWDH